MVYEMNQRSDPSLQNPPNMPKIPLPQFQHLGLRAAFGALRPKPQFARQLATLVTFGVLVVACDKPASDNSATHSSAQPVAVSSTAPSSSEKTSPAGALASAAPSASAAADNAADSVFVGTWEGRYDAKKGDVGMPPRVEDKVRNKDDGKTAIGAGTVTITIAKSLELEGASEGALGASKIRGKVDVEEIRASFDPSDVLDKHGMYGIISGKRNGDKIEARIRVANGDATVVREAEVVLKKKQ